MINNDDISQQYRFTCNTFLKHISISSSITLVTILNHLNNQNEEEEEDDAQDEDEEEDDDEQQSTTEDIASSWRLLPSVDNVLLQHNEG